MKLTCRTIGFSKKFVAGIILRFNAITNSYTNSKTKKFTKNVNSNLVQLSIKTFPPSIVIFDLNVFLYFNDI